MSSLARRCLCFVLVLTASSASAASLQTLDGRVFGLSADGSTAVGVIGAGSGFVWTASGGYQPIEPIETGGVSYGRAASADGSVVVGDTDAPSVAIRWTAAAGTEALSGATALEETATAVSRDGSTIVGWAGNEAVRWDATGALGLGFIEPTYEYAGSFALAISDDGSVVGFSSTSTAEYEAFRWTEAGGMVGLGHLDAGESSMSLAFDVSADGSIIVGESTILLDGELVSVPVLWTGDEILQLGFSHQEDADEYSSARAITADGSTVVGISGLRASIWDAEHGMRDLNEVLVEQYGLDLGGWTLIEALGVSDDGLTIAGNGVDAQGVERGWIAHLVPEPTLATLSGVAVAALLALRRYRFA